MVRQETDLTFCIRFRSSFRNFLIDPVADVKASASDLKLFLSYEESVRESTTYGYVSLLVDVGISAKRMQSWRMSLHHPLNTIPGIAGTTIGYLVPEDPQWLDVNLANPRARTHRIKAVASLIRSAALPYFEEFRNPNKIVAALATARNPGMSPNMEIEYASCYGGKEDARRVLNRYLENIPAYVLAEYKRRFGSIGTAGFRNQIPKWGRPGRTLRLLL